ncbi:MAG: potassium-transporting ATPase ATP-binding subunit, partial [Acidimicrobiaceae bacterium]|nr:potassium-transporting ATPase ATP-binding subunit [Acidimicrobiaceae bacterium]
MSVIPAIPTSPTKSAPPDTGPLKPKERTKPKPGMSLFAPKIVRRAARDALVKTNPRHQVRNPVMFVVLVGSVWTTVLFVR